MNSTGNLATRSDGESGPAGVGVTQNRCTDDDDDDDEGMDDVRAWLRQTSS